MKGLLKLLLCVEIVMGLLGCGGWLYNRSFWNGSSALLGLVLSLLQLPMELCAYIVFARCGARRERCGKLCEEVRIHAVWNVEHWNL